MSARFDLVSASLGLVAGATLWSQLQATPQGVSPPVSASATVPSYAVAEPARNQQADPAPPPTPVAMELPPAPPPPPSVVAAPQEEPPELLGTIVGTPSVAAIFEYQGHQRVMHEGQRIGPFKVGGIYARSATLQGPNGKLTLHIKPQSAAAVDDHTGSEADRWVRTFALTQILHDGLSTGVVLRRPDGSSPLAQYGIHEDDVILGLNHKPIRQLSDMWWVHQELQHASRVEWSVMRGDKPQTLCQELSQR